MASLPTAATRRHVQRARRRHDTVIWVATDARRRRGRRKAIARQHADLHHITSHDSTPLHSTPRYHGIRYGDKSLEETRRCDDAVGSPGFTTHVWSMTIVTLWCLVCLSRSSPWFCIVSLAPAALCISLHRRSSSPRRIPATTSPTGWGVMSRNRGRRGSYVTTSLSATSRSERALRASRPWRVKDGRRAAIAAAPTQRQRRTPQSESVR